MDNIDGSFQFFMVKEVMEGDSPFNLEGTGDEFLTVNGTFHRPIQERPSIPDDHQFTHNDGVEGDILFNSWTDYIVGEVPEQTLDTEDYRMQQDERFGVTEEDVLLNTLPDGNDEEMQEQFTEVDRIQGQQPTQEPALIDALGAFFKPHQGSFQYVEATAFLYDEESSVALPALRKDENGLYFGRKLDILVPIPEEYHGNYTAIAPGFLFERDNHLWPVAEYTRADLCLYGTRRIDNRRNGERVFLDNGLTVVQHELLQAANGEHYVHYICCATVASTYFQIRRLHFGLFREARVNNEVVHRDVVSTTFPLKVLNRGFQTKIFPRV